MRTLMLVVAVVASSAWAQCNSDAECPSGGACTSGACVTPSTPTAAPAAATSPSVGDQAGKVKGWAGGGAAIGFIGTGPVVVSGIISMVFLIFGPNYSTTGPGVVFTVLTTALVGALGPIAEAGAASARVDDETNYGSPGSRVVGWIMYGVSIAAGGAALATWFVANDVALSFLLGLGMLVTGATSLLLFALDAVESGIGAIRTAKKRGSSSSRGAPLRVMPLLSLAPSRTGGFDAVLGLSGTF